jgi:hypothetical protein
MVMTVMTVMRCDGDGGCACAAHPSSWNSRVPLHARAHRCCLLPDPRRDPRRDRSALVIFCPFCLHSGSPNLRGPVPRYVVVQSFQHHARAQLLRENLLRKCYLRCFHRDAHAAVGRLAPALAEMLRGRHLWGEAMRSDLAAFRERGYFVMEGGGAAGAAGAPVIAPQLMARLEALQREVEPEWRAT